MNHKQDVSTTATMSPLKIILLYAAVSLLWIAASDSIAAWLAGDVDTFQQFALIKGCLFVIITAGLLHHLITRYSREINASRDSFQNARILAEQEIEQLSHYDPETGLPNQTLLLDRLHQILALSSRERRKTAVIYISLTGYKGIIDTLGHQGVITVMRGIAEHLNAALRQYDTVARIHRDEFVIALGGSVQDGDLTGVLNKLQHIFAMPLPIEDGECAIPACIGVACFPADGLTAEVLLQNSHIAMNQARQSGISSQFYSESMNKRAVERYSIEAGMLRAIDDGEFFLCYQPKIALEDMSVIGMEALVRWRRPGSGIVPPDSFIPVAEDNGMIVRLGAWVLREACRQNREWQDRGRGRLRVSVNIAARQLRENLFVEQVVDILESTGLAPDCLELELTETAVMADSDDTVQKLLKLKQLGVAVSVDDFGTGYSSLSYLKHLPLDTIKVDRSFVRDITSDLDDAAIVEAVIAIAHALKLNLVAEGVETAEQLEYLRARNCHAAQGYLFSKPLEARAYEEYLQSGVAVGTVTGRTTDVTQGDTSAGGCSGAARGENRAGAVEYLQDISLGIPPAHPTDNLTIVLKRFQTDPQLKVLPVVDQGRVVGILNRATFLEEHVIGMHGFAFHINHNKKLRDLMNPVFMTIESTTLIKDAAQLIQTSETRVRIDNVCTTRRGEYQGVVDIDRFIAAITEINLKLAKGANPLTGLPGNESIQREIGSRLENRVAFDIAYIDIDNFKPYNDYYGFQKGDIVIKALGEIIMHVLNTEHSTSFCGHIGGDDFILITDPHLSEAISWSIIREFEGHRPQFHGVHDFSRGSYTTPNRKGETETFTLLSLSIGIVDTLHTPVISYAQLASIATDVKKAAKKQAGSSVVINQRNPAQ